MSHYTLAKETRSPKGYTPQVVHSTGDVACVICVSQRILFRLLLFDFLYWLLCLASLNVSLVLNVSVFNSNHNR